MIPMLARPRSLSAAINEDSQFREGFPACRALENTKSHVDCGRDVGVLIRVGRVFGQKFGLPVGRQGQDSEIPYFRHRRVALSAMSRTGQSCLK